MQGVIRTRVGYAGGARPDPTYHRLGDHSEVVQIDFDPRQITYAQLLAVFWQSHDPTSQAWSRQYRTAVFYHDDIQQRLAQESRERVAARLGGRIHTTVEPATTFYLAEGYHQKYYLQQSRTFWAEYLRVYPAVGDLINSTAAARVNGYLAGYGAAQDFQADLPRLGLSPEAREKLYTLVAGSRRFRQAEQKGEEAGAACPRPGQ